ncbi:MAG TPA: ABC transporter substrate-binding protein [Thermoanaerobaculia bacterium]|jgi:ABC-type transport system substrate-binding protein|nr:ABC transporter substrate-binding protein [Thermoanaerobaculia bacterium]
MLTTKLANRYEVAAELGRGGMGVVYRARDPMLNREVAVKVLATSELTPEIEERFQREAQIVAQMDHPGIVPIYDVGRHDGSLFFVMPLVDGTNLRRILYDGSLKLGEVLDIATQVADALDYSHSRGVVHRDIKPENIMVARDESGALRIRVMDFGLAHATTENRLTKTGTLVGTVTYLSPEQVTAHAFDGRSDIYSLGTVMYECLTGEPPFTGEVQSVLYRIVHEIPQPPRSLGAEIREELQNIILQCLEKDPLRRHQKAAQLSEALRRHRSTLHSDEFAMSVVATASRTLQRPSASAFVGREKEFAELQRRLNSAVSGDCQFAVVAGEPGIGKTRLLEELKKLVAMRKIRVLYGRFIEQDQAFSYQGFCELVQDYFRSREAGSSAGEKADFSDLAPDLLSLFPLLTEISELRSAASGGSRVASSADQRKAEDRIQIFELLARTLTRMAAGKPLVLVLENLHAAEVSIEALQYIVRRLGPTPTFFVGSYRQTEVDKRHPLARMLDSFADDPRFVSITLGPLSPTEHRGLVESVVGAPNVSDDLAKRVYDATEGNPFFTKELLRSLIDSGGIARDVTGEWTFSQGTGISSDALPATIQQAVEKRIERLPEDLRDLLSIASVLGRSFDFADLEVLAEGAGKVEDSIDRLVREGVFDEEREARGDRLAFSSGIVRDVLYGALSRRKRRSLHRKYAELIEERYAGRLERIYPDLLHHFSQADNPEKTVEYGLKLARKSLDAFSADDASRAAKTALEYLEDEEWSGDRSLEGEARLLLAEGHRISGNADGALRDGETAVRIFERERQPEKALGAILFAAETAWQARRTEETRRWAERGLEAARSLEKSEALTRLLSLAATVANLRGEYAKAASYLSEIERLKPRERTQEEVIPGGGTLVVAMANPIASIEPGDYETTEEHEVVANVFETLVTTDAQGGLVPLLAEKWSLSDGGKTVRLRLRRGVVFSDGTPLTAPAAKRSFERSIALSREAMPAAYAAISGIEEYLEETAKGVSGITVVSESELDIRLREVLPVYPAFLTDGRTSMASAVTDVDGTERVLGTGPFLVTSHAADSAVLERNPNYWKDSPSRLDRIEFRASLSASEIAAGLRAGQCDVARDLLPQDREAILRDPRFRSGLVETPKKNTYFALFNGSGAAAESPVLRRALSDAARARDFVWGTLGRFALPATGIIPPGILGHDAGRRLPHASREKAAEMVRSAGLSLPVRLRASVHPILKDQYGALTSSLLASWAELGVEVTIATNNMAEYLASWNDTTGFDLFVGRWIADYDDPDNFTFTLFHSGNGRLRRYFSSRESDEILEEARRESRAAAREVLYRSFESLVLESAVLVPLFHDVDYRIAAPAVRGITLKSTAPFINYTEVGKTAAAPAPSPARAAGGGILTVPIAGVIRTLDPSRAETVEQGEVLPNVFEGLLRETEGAQVVPWLASEVLVENDGRRYRFRLRPGIRFQDGRRLTARDVRYTFERLLGNHDSDRRWTLAPISGAKAVLSGEATGLEGFHIVTPTEFYIDLDQPISFFPVLMSDLVTSIVPEGTVHFGHSWREGAVGTGAFRVVGFEPGQRLEVERNPHYWRDGYPRSEGIVFRFGVQPEEMRAEFLAGRFSVASDLLPRDAEALRQDRRYATGYKESPRLSTYFIAFNIHRRAFGDPEVRRGIRRAIDVSALVRRTLGRLAIPASGLIPPGLLGYAPATERVSDAARPVPVQQSSDKTMSRETVEVAALVHSSFAGEYVALIQELNQTFREMGFELRPINKNMNEYVEMRKTHDIDVVIGRWASDYPDADTFVHGVLQTEEGFMGLFCGTPEIDQLGERGRAEMDPRVRHSIYRQVEEIVARDALLIPLFHEQVYRFIQPDVEGLSLGFSLPTVAYDKLSVRR